MNSLVWIIMDSCRYDSFADADTPTVRRFCESNSTKVEKRYSYASWTAPSHYAFLMGLVPHYNPTGVFAAEVYKHEFTKWNNRLGIKNLSFRDFLPQLSLVKVLRDLGYRTVGRVSLPVLNEMTLLASHFDDYRLMDNHNDFRGMIREMTFSETTPTFYFLNLGETHYPYMLDAGSLPRLSGLHGTLKRMGDDHGDEHIPTFFDMATMERLRAQQIRCVEHIDSTLEELFCKCAKGTHIMLTADHGELFGEDGFFGHGPIWHRKVFEVPFVEGKAP